MTAVQHYYDRDGATIAAIATPPGSGGIGIIRISGPKSRSILSMLFVPHRDKPLVTHQLTYGRLIDPESDRIVDEVMAVLMAAPHSYTREDVVEIQCHSSYLVLQKILELVLNCGAVAAEPGEFTKRAFLKGRIDLTQAEAVIDLLQAKTGEGLQIALSQLEGGLHEQVGEIRDTLTECRAVIEVAIDFPDEDVEIINSQRMATDLRDRVVMPLTDLVNAANRGKIFREGISAVILGRPNVGKSSLLNSLLREERAIVTEIPGTTRDIIEEYLDVKGIPVRIIDTAGIRQSAETVEEIGIRKAREKLEEADLVLMVVDVDAELTSEDLTLADLVGGQPTILVMNKTDLVPDKDLKPYRDAFPDFSSVEVSAKNRIGLDHLEEAVFAKVCEEENSREAVHSCVPNVRHAASLAGALAAVGQLIIALGEDLSPDLVAIELQTALDHLGDIVGETTTDDILDTIFTRFCLGK